jgi:hypothetical protein
VGQIVAVEPSVGNHRGEPSVGIRSADRAKSTQSEEASLTSANRHLADNDARQCITQNHRKSEYGRDPTNLGNIINDK